MSTPYDYDTCGCGRRKKIEAARCRSCWLRKIGNTQEAFWQRVEKGEGCWKWTGGVYDKRRAHQRRGYFVVNGRQRVASRLAWEWTYGPIPKGLFVCHKCDNSVRVR